jgi:hypothetical protein
MKPYGKMPLRGNEKSTLLTRRQILASGVAMAGTIPFLPTQSRVNSDSNLSQNRLKRTMREASWTKPRKLWAWYSQRMKIRRCH